MGGTNLDNVAAAVARAGHLRGEPAPFLAEARDGERFLEELYGARPQIRIDAWRIENGYLDAAQWHFFASSRSGKIGASKGVLDALDGAGIGYTIHLPV